MARSYVFSKDEYYHIYNRGTEKRNIFLTEKDYQRFLFLLFICNNSSSVEIRNYRNLSTKERFDLKRSDTIVDIGAYCLMPNHFHLLVKEKNDGGISIFMQKLTTAYTMYFNQINNRMGSLFEGSFKAKHITDDTHLKYLYAYIHLNPIKKIRPNWKEENLNTLKIKNFLNSYQYSSYLDFVGINLPTGNILNKSVFPDYFNEKSSFTKFIENWIENRNFPEV